MKKVLFVCVHNSARSQIAEAYLNKFGKGKFISESAGLEPGTLNPFVVKVLKEDGIDISAKKTSDVFNFLKQGKQFDYVVTVCDETSGEKCPFFPGTSLKLHWGFEDPSSFSGTGDEILNRIRHVRDLIKDKIIEFIINYA